jgi:hypothetical protein
MHGPINIKNVLERKIKRGKEVTEDKEKDVSSY